MSVVSGVRLGTGRGGISASKVYEGRDDVLVMAIDAGASVAGVFTQNGFRAPPVDLVEERLAQFEVLALLVNTGNANAATGEEGYRRAEECCRMVADRLGIDPESVLPFSTGVIGEQLPLEPMRKGIAKATEMLIQDAWPQAATAIMTTDTVPKLRTRELEIGGRKVSICGIAKGAGMIAPNMATMLAFIATDASIEQALLSECLAQITEESFNRVTVDGDTSTNDACILVATGASGVRVGEESESFWNALGDLMNELASALIEDAEGGNKTVRVLVEGGRSSDECERVARCIAESPLVKTAIFAEDPNWGRICMAMGNADLEDFDQSLVDLYIGEVPVMTGGLASPNYTEEAVNLVMRQAKYSLRVSLGRGSAQGELLTSDLSHGYVKINADYRT